MSLDDLEVADIARHVLDRLFLLLRKGKSLPEFVAAHACVQQRFFEEMALVSLSCLGHRKNFFFGFQDFPGRIVGFSVFSPKPDHFGILLRLLDFLRHLFQSQSSMGHLDGSRPPKILFLEDGFRLGQGLEQGFPVQRGGLDSLSAHDFQGFDDLPGHSVGEGPLLPFCPEDFVVQNLLSLPGKVTQEIEEAKKEPEMVRLRGKDGKTYYTTREVLKTEKEILAMAEAGKTDQNHLLEKTLVDANVARYEFRKGFSLSEEQKEAIRHMTSDVGLLQIVQGHAGAGKSTALTPVREAYEAAGFEVVGCALQGKTAAGLQSSTEIKSQTMHSLLNEIEGYDREDGTRVEPTRALDKKTVIVVDEAAMVGTRLLHRLQTQAAKAGAKLILVGDEAQVPPVSAGSPFRRLKKEVGAVELTENRRQKKEWQQEASREIREGSVREALMRYAKEQMIEVVPTKEDAIRTNVENWDRSFDPDKPADAILTSFRREATALQNQAAREKMKERGILGMLEATVQVRDRTGQSKGKRDFAQGDRIAFGKNDRKVGVMNGENGTVERIEKDKQGEWEFRVKKDDGKIVTFSPSAYSQIDHGYAITINKSQGMTAARSFNLVGGTGLEHLYVQMTRHEQGAHLVLVEDQIDRAAEEAGIDLPPTEKMLKFMETFAGDREIDIPEETRTNFDACRKWLNSYAYRIGGNVGDATELDFGLEKVASLIDLMGRSREKVNAMDFDILDEKEKKEERSLGKEVQGKSEGRNMEAPSPEREHGKEEGSRPPEREREYEWELEMGF